MFVSEFRSQAVPASLELCWMRLLWLHDTFGEGRFVRQIQRDETRHLRRQQGNRILVILS
jgi:hypothetical protein